jgi:Transglycosylase SLT domain/Domain of unknown function (DUF4124)
VPTRAVTRAFVTLVLLVCIVTPAAAQIYTWRDDTGQLILSDRPRGTSPVYTSSTYRVADSDFRSTRAVAAHRGERFDPIIREHAANQGLSENLVRAVIQVESAFNPRAVSSKGAMGLMQLMPAVATEFGVLNPFDPADNIRAGVAYLRRLLDRYDGRIELALAAYNAGPAAVDKYGEQVPPYRETRDYVRRIKSVTPVAIGPKRTIYKIVEIIDGREVPRYSDTKPAGEHSVVTRR